MTKPKSLEERVRGIISSAFEVGDFEKILEIRRALDLSGEEIIGFFPDINTVVQELYQDYIKEWLNNRDIHSGSSPLAGHPGDILHRWDILKKNTGIDFHTEPTDIPNIMAAQEYALLPVPITMDIYGCVKPGSNHDLFNDFGVFLLLAGATGVKPSEATTTFAYKHCLNQHYEVPWAKRIETIGSIFNVTGIKPEKRVCQRMLDVSLFFYVRDGSDFQEYGHISSSRGHITFSEEAFATLGSTIYEKQDDVVKRVLDIIPPESRETAIRHAYNRIAMVGSAPLLKRAISLLGIPPKLRPRYVQMGYLNNLANLLSPLNFIEQWCNPSPGKEYLEILEQDIKEAKEEIQKYTQRMREFKQLTGVEVSEPTLARFYGYGKRYFSDGCNIAGTVMLALQQCGIKPLTK